MDTARFEIEVLTTHAAGRRKSTRKHQRSHSRSATMQTLVSRHIIISQCLQRRSGDGKPLSAKHLVLTSTQQDGRGRRGPLSYLYAGPFLAMNSFYSLERCLRAFRTSSNFMRQSNPPAPHWTGDDVPDLAGKVVLVTGGNTGIGMDNHISPFCVYSYQLAGKEVAKVMNNNILLVVILRILTFDGLGLPHQRRKGLYCMQRRRKDSRSYRFT